MPNSKSSSSSPKANSGNFKIVKKYNQIFAAKQKTQKLVQLFKNNLENKLYNFNTKLRAAEKNTF